MPKKSHYINTNEFEDLIIKYNKSRKGSKNHLSYQEELVKQFRLLAENIVRGFKFKIDWDDAIQEGILICLDKVKKYDKSKGRGFNYCTTIIINHFKQIYRNNKVYYQLKEAYRDHLIRQDQYGIRKGRPMKSKRDY